MTSCRSGCGGATIWAVDLTVRPCRKGVPRDPLVRWGSRGSRAADKADLILLGQPDDQGREAKVRRDPSELVDPGAGLSVERHEVDGALDLGGIPAGQPGSFVDGRVHRSRVLGLDVAIAEARQPA